MDIAVGTRITTRGEDFLVTNVDLNHDDSHLIHAEGISELVKGKHYIFDTNIEEDIEVLAAINTQLLADTETGYKKTKLFLETQIRNAAVFSNKIVIADNAAFNMAQYQLTPTL